MRLRSAMGVALAGVIFLISPAAANPIGSPTEPAAGRSVSEAAVVSPDATKADQTSSAGADRVESNQPNSAEGAAAPSFVTPASLHVPVPERNQFKPKITLKAIVDLTKQRMTVISHDKVLHVWPISSGRSGYQTPNGVYHPQWRARMWYSRQYDNAPMPYAVFFHRGYAVHGTYATGLLGRPASHGCIRLSNKNAATFFKLVEQHGMESTQIVVQGKANVGPPKVAKGRGRQIDPRRVVNQRPPAPRGYVSYRYGAPSPWWTW